MSCLSPAGYCHIAPAEIIMTGQMEPAGKGKGAQENKQQSRAERKAQKGAEVANNMDKKKKKKEKGAGKGEEKPQTNASGSKEAGAKSVVEERKVNSA
mgnify:CR=1 FL=1